MRSLYYTKSNKSVEFSTKEGFYERFFPGTPYGGVFSGISDEELAAMLSCLGRGSKPFPKAPACSHHSRIIRNLLSELAEKNLRLNEKLTHMG